MRPGNIYSTSDAPFSAYLLLRGFILLGAIDTETQRKEFAFTSDDPHVLSGLEAYVNQAYDEYENMRVPIPHAPDVIVSFKEYANCMKTVKTALHDPIRRDNYDVMPEERT